MKIYEKREKHIVIEEKNILIETKCDLCGATTKNSWQKGCFSAIESIVQLRTGTNYPEGGDGEYWTIDICPDCFMKKLIPWVKSQGGNPTMIEWDW